MLLNVNTLNSDKINCIETDLELFKNLQFLCLSEIGVKQECLDFLHINDFNLISFYCRPNLKCGGVSIWSKCSRNIKKIDLDKFCIEQNFEICAISYKINKFVNIILNCYRSPCGEVDVFFNRISDVLDYLYQPNVRIFLCGDFNFDKYKCSNFVNLCNLLSCFGLTHVVNWPTRITNSTCTIIDQIFTNACDNNFTCCVVDNVFSDHRTVLLDISFNFSQNVSSKINMKRNFSQANISSFKNALMNEKWVYLDDKIMILMLPFICFTILFDFILNHTFLKEDYVQKINNKKWVDVDVVRSSQAIEGLICV